MITKQDILDRAGEWQLRADVVEKDYVLGWLLAAMGQHPVTSREWVFKGGTCLKKCYFETYRFSEDLDFSLLPSAPYTREAIATALREVGEQAHEMSGIEFPADLTEVRQTKNLQGQSTFKGKMAYRGPLQYPGPPRVLFDITQHEPLFEASVQRPIFHPYPDASPDGATIRAYSLDELLAEKARALFERTRPRDLYDVVFILENQSDALRLDRVRTLFVEKCRTKQLAAPSQTAFMRHIESEAELRSEWTNMLGHQLPQLPTLDSMMTRVPALLGWVEAPVPAPAARLAAVPAPAGQSLVAPSGIQYSGTGSVFEQVRFAGSNRLKIEFDYDGKHRLAEPYSFRRAETGNALLYAWEDGSTHIKAFNVSKIHGLHVSQVTFAPRYRIEFTSGGSTPILAMPQRTRTSRNVYRTRRTQTTRPRSRFGPKYVFECPYCRKRFQHATNDPTLQKHKTKDGWNCSSRRGYLVEMK